MFLGGLGLIAITRLGPPLVLYILIPIAKQYINDCLYYITAIKWLYSQQLSKLFVFAVNNLYIFDEWPLYVQFLFFKLTVVFQALRASFAF